jgi:hypothetical protein
LLNQLAEVALALGGNVGHHVLLNLFGDRDPFNLGFFCFLGFFIRHFFFQPFELGPKFSNLACEITFLRCTDCWQDKQRRQNHDNKFHFYLLLDLEFGCCVFHEDSK